MGDFRRGECVGYARKVRFQVLSAGETTEAAACESETDEKM